MSKPVSQLQGVSRETFRKLEVYVEILVKWNKSINLVSSNTLESVWLRHIEDSLQISGLGLQAGQWLDLGSGGGLPGLIIAASSPDIHVTMIESDQRKCAFIAAAADAMGLNVSIECRRIEESTTRTYDIVSARALAPLSNLLELALPYRHEKTVCVFPKGTKAKEEMKAALQNWNVIYDTVQSITDPSASIFRVREYSRVT